MTPDLQECWSFKLAVEKADGSALSHQTEEGLVDAIIDWVEARDLQIGGSAFNFSLESADGASVSREAANALLAAVLAWAEARDLRASGVFEAGQAPDGADLFPVDD